MKKETLEILFMIMSIEKFYISLKKTEQENLEYDDSFFTTNFFQIYSNNISPGWIIDKMLCFDNITISFVCKTYFKF